MKYLNLVQNLVGGMITRLSQKPDYLVSKTAKVWRSELIKIGKGTQVQDYVIILTKKSRVEIGKYCQLNPFTVIYGGSGIYIGDNVMIAPHCMLDSGNHDYIQTEKPMRFAGDLSHGPIRIEDDVWIGANATITDGVRIGKDAVVAANSVVTKSVPSYEIYAGVPAKKIGSRKR